MLAILVLAAVTAIAFSLATIVFIEVRLAGDALRTEPALYAAFGVTEEALFQYKRFYTGSNMDVTTCGQGGSDTYNICNLNGVLLSLPPTQPIAFDDSPRVENVPAHTTKVLAMFSISDPANYYTQLYSSLSVQLLPTSSTGVYVTLNYIDSNDQSHPVIDRQYVPPTISNFTNFNASGQYELTLENTGNNDASVSISTTRVNNAQPPGLPFIGEQVLRIKADYQGLNRTYQVRIPVP